MAFCAVFVSGLSFSGARTWPPIATGNDGWENSLTRDFPGINSVISVSHVDRAHSPSKDTWNAIDGLARTLSEYLNKRNEDTSEAPLVFFCQGLGGYIMLKALGFHRDGSPTEVQLALRQKTAAIILLGTPLNPIKDRNFREAIRACATVELGKGWKANKPDEDECSNLTNMIQSFGRTKASLVSVYEGTATRIPSKKARWLFKFFRRPKMIVCKEMAKFANATLISSSESHIGIGNFNKETYEAIVKIIRPKLDAHQKTPTSERRPTTASGVSSEPRMRSQMDEFGPPPHVITKYHLIDFPESMDFIGRQKVLVEMTSYLVGHIEEAPRTGSNIRGGAFELHGPRGSGKTQTARKFAAKEADHFPYILWVAADEETKLVGTYAKFAVGLGLADDTTNLYTASERLCEWFAVVSKPFLVIFDNAKDPDLIIKWWPTGDMGSVLVTTLDPSFKTTNVAGNGMLLPDMEEEEAIRMVLSQVHSKALTGNTEDDRREAQTLVRRVSCLPLAVQTCVGSINAAERTLKHYNERHTESGPIVDKSLPGEASPPWAPYPQSLKETMEDRLSTLDVDSRALLDVFSLFDPSKIPEQPFCFVGRTVPSYLQTVTFVQPKIFDECIRKLSNGLVMLGSGNTGRNRPNANSANELGKWDLGVFHIHDLYCQFLRSELAKSVKRRQVAFDTATKLISRILDRSEYPKDPDVTPRMTERKLFLEYFSHVESIRKFFESTREKEEARRKTRLSTQEEGPETRLRIPAAFLQLMYRSTWICYTTGFLEDGLIHAKTGERVLEELEKDPRLLSPAGSQDAETMYIAKRGIFHSYASIATEIGDFSLSLEMFQKGLAVYEEATRNGVDPPDKKGPAGIYGGIANSYQGLGDHLKAETYYAKWFESAKSVDELHSPYPVNRCRSLWARDEYDAASAELERLISLRETRYGETDTKDHIIGHMKYVLGNVRISQNRLDEAFELHKGSLACWKITLGEHHHKVGDCYHKVGWHHARLSQWNEARTMLEQALDVYKSGKDEGFRHAEIARTSYKLGLVLQEFPGETQKAAEAIEVAKEFRRKVLQKSGRPVENEDVGEDEYDALVSLWAR
ncbi:hypothetical protein QBC39DRAFT_346112 [Podospora conica]|nr:hypothetical protein QBC39DRAFT_346112 [Schizothecium conicum]